MSTKVLDRRIQRTRQLLQDSLIALILEKGYEAVTVQDVIDHANVGRSTFYTHFRDLDELLLSRFESLWARFEEHVSNKASDNEGIWTLSQLMFRHAQDYHQVFQAMMGKQSGHIIEVHVSKQLTIHIRKSLEQEWSDHKATVISLEILTYHLVSSLVALLRWWLDHDRSYNAEQMQQLYIQLIQPSLLNIGLKSGTGV